MSASGTSGGRSRGGIESSPSRWKNKVGAAPTRRGVFLVPATITSLGLLSGFYSMVSSLGGHFELAASMILLALVCDGLDGRVARMSRTSSRFGVEYDSLSDVVAFGAAPAIMIYSWALKPIGRFGIAITGFYVLCSALRLARFNVQTGSIDKRRFVGLPVPGAAMLLAAIALSYSYLELDSPRVLCTVMAPITALLASLMISRVPYPSFKGIKLERRAQIELLIGVIVFAAMLFAIPQLTTLIVAAAYVLSGPSLMIRGEQLQAKVSVLRPMPNEDEHGASDSEKPAPTIH
jgi:CDP-diacylglycerol--serine O-phosphatidyltransferase